MLIRAIIFKKGGVKLKPKELIKKLQELGWFVVRVQGSHHIMKHKDNPAMITVPVHNKDLKPGTLHNILKIAGIK